MVITRRPTLELNTGSKNELEIFLRKGSRIKCGPIVLLIKGLIMTIIGILLTIWTPFQMLMDERIRMHRGLPAFEWWKNPPDLLLLRARAFNYTNIEEYVNGSADKLRVEEIGPIIYKEKFIFSNITFNPNSTITYVANHTAEYIPELNHLNLNETILVPNYALLSMATFLFDAPFFAKLGFNMLVRRLKTQLYTKMTLQDFLWNYTDPILDLTNHLLPHMVPVRNMGMLHTIYQNLEDTVTMYIGTEHGHERFSLIDQFSGSSDLPHYKNCNDKLTNASEGVTYNQYLTKQSVLRYWRKTVCKVAELIYQNELVHSGVDAYKYILPNYTYNRTQPKIDDCYRGYPDLPNGLSDVSNCMYKVPIAASFPHFMYGDQKIKEYVEGLTPDPDKHESFVIAEPLTGIPLESIARSQSNIVVRKLEGFNREMKVFEDMTLPMFWLEYHQTGIPLKVHILVYFVSVIAQPAQVILVITLITLGFLYVIRFGKQVTSSDNYKKLALQRNILLKEQEFFLKNGQANSVI